MSGFKLFGKHVEAIDIDVGATDDFTSWFETSQGVFQLNEYIINRGIGYERDFITVLLTVRFI